LLAYSVAFNLLAGLHLQAQLQCGLGSALQEKGRVDEAITHYQRALEIESCNTSALCDLGSALLQKGKIEEAFPKFQKALQIQPDFAQAHNNLGNALMLSGRVDDAIAHFQKAVEIQADYADAHYNLGDALLLKGRVDEAITHYQTALQIKPEYAEAQNNLGNALLQKGRVAEAIPHFQKALQIRPDDPIFQNNLAWQLATAPEASLRDGGRALELARRANTLTGGANPVILRTLAAACAQAGLFPEAVATGQKALRAAQAQSNTGLAAALQSELKLYQAGGAFHGPIQTH
jgi:tetratricopeptide (TPR) repeat protein